MYMCMCKNRSLVSNKSSELLSNNFFANESNLLIQHANIHVLLHSDILYRGKFSGVNIFVQRKVPTFRTELILVRSCSQTMHASAFNASVQYLILYKSDLYEIVRKYIPYEKFSRYSDNATEID